MVCWTGVRCPGIRELGASGVEGSSGSDLHHEPVMVDRRCVDDAGSDRRRSHPTRAGRRRRPEGYLLVEALVAGALLLFLTQVSWWTAASHGRASARLVEEARLLDQVRLSRHVLTREVRGDPHPQVADGALRLRAFRGVGLRCVGSGVEWWVAVSGDRALAPEKDSILLLQADGTWASGRVVQRSSAPRRPVSSAAGLRGGAVDTGDVCRLSLGGPLLRAGSIPILRRRPENGRGWALAAPDGRDVRRPGKRLDPLGPVYCGCPRGSPGTYGLGAKPELEIAGSVLIRRGWETGGFALASVILAMALLMAFVLTALTAGRGQVVVGGQSLDWIQARLSAESAVHRFIEETRGLSPLAPGATLPAFRSGLSGNRPWTVSLFRTGLEHHAVIARSRLRGGEPTTAAARLVWWLSPGARVSTFKASLEVGDLAGSDIPPTGVMAVADALALVGPHGSCRGSPDTNVPLGPGLRGDGARRPRAPPRGPGMGRRALVGLSSGHSTRPPHGPSPVRRGRRIPFRCSGLLRVPDLLVRPHACRGRNATLRLGCGPSDLDGRSAPGPWGSLGRVGSRGRKSGDGVREHDHRARQGRRSCRSLRRCVSGRVRVCGLPKPCPRTRNPAPAECRAAVLDRADFTRITANKTRPWVRYSLEGDPDWPYAVAIRFINTCFCPPSRSDKAWACSDEKRARSDSTSVAGS